MFERFTDKARLIVVLAQDEARELGHGSIGPEHLLLGLVRLEQGAGLRALEAAGISPAAVREQVESMVPRREGPPSARIPFTPQAKQVLELSLREALQFGHRYIGSEHILLGLLAERRGVAAQALTRLGASLDGMRQQVDMVLGAARPDEEP